MLGEKVSTPPQVHAWKALPHTLAILVLATPFITKLMHSCVCALVFLFFWRNTSFHREGPLALSAQLSPLRSNVES